MIPFPVTMILLFIESTIINILVPDLRLECENVPIKFQRDHHYTLLPGGYGLSGSSRASSRYGASNGCVARIKVK